jgi:predicted permease
VVNGLILHPLHFTDADRLIIPLHADPRSSMLLYPDGHLLEAWRSGARTLESVEASGGGEVTVQVNGEPRIVRAASASHGLFELLRLKPRLGRDFSPDDETHDAPNTVILGHGFWRTTFGADRSVLGRDLIVDGTMHTIIGVAPADLVLPIGPERDRDVWLPLRLGPEGVYEAQGLLPIARLRDDVSVAQAATELTSIAQRVSTDRNDRYADWLVRLATPADLLRSSVRTSLLVLLGAVGLVLLIVCANVANLLLARATAREGELAVRAALGATRARLSRQLMLESLLLGGVGGAAGLVLAHWGLDLIVALRPESLSELEHVRIDGRVAGFVVAMTLLASLAFGMFPAVRAARHALVGRLRSGAPAILGSARARRMTGGFITAQVALSLVLLTGAGLFVRSLIALQQRPLGFQPGGLVVVGVNPPRYRYPSGTARAAFLEQIREASASLPGIESAHLVVTVPPGYGIASRSLEIEGILLEDRDLSPFFTANYVAAEYFDVLGVEVRSGRSMREGERDVVVVNERFAQRFFPSGDAVGKRIRFSDDGAWTTIIGVAADLPAQGLATAEPLDQLHFPLAADPELAPEMLLLRTGLQMPALRTALQTALAQLDAEVPVHSVRTISDYLRASLDVQRFNLVLLTALAIMAMLLSAVGLYGVVSVAISQRTREIGIRRALGETDRGVMRLAFVEGLRPTIIGIALGLIGAVLMSRIMTSLLFGLSPRDPLTFTLVPCLLAAVALLACWIPARRATRIEPMNALRWER